jgi:hypothetical protein
MKLKAIAVCGLFFLIGINANAQMLFNKVFGKKATYSIEVPKQYYSKEAIGANVDIKYIDKYGASVITVVKTLPQELGENDINQMNEISDYEFIDIMEAMGSQNISLIKRGFIYINGVKSHYAYYRDVDLYYHSITQFKKGKNFNLTYTCAYQEKESYMPYIFRVVNSIKWK